MIKEIKGNQRCIECPLRMYIGKKSSVLILFFFGSAILYLIGRKEWRERYDTWHIYKIEIHIFLSICDKWK
jgi:hypothetical protein